MLLLIRRIGEEILIDHGKIKIKFIEANHGAIAVAIHAPPEIEIDQPEISLRKKLIYKVEKQGGKHILRLPAHNQREAVNES